LEEFAQAFDFGVVVLEAAFDQGIHLDYVRGSRVARRIERQGGVFHAAFEFGDDALILLAFGLGFGADLVEGFAGSGHASGHHVRLPFRIVGGDGA